MDTDQQIPGGEVNLSLTPGFSPVCKAAGNENRFNGFGSGREVSRRRQSVTNRHRLKTLESELVANCNQLKTGCRASQLVTNCYRLKSEP